MEYKENIVPAIDRALDIIEFIGFEKGHATIKEITKALKIPIVSVSRIMKNLVSRGYIEKNKGSPSTFSLGMKILYLSQVIITQRDVVQIALKHMKILTDKTNQTCSLAILQGNSVIYIAQVLPKKPLSIVAPLHMLIPLNNCSSGKVLCAWKSTEEQKDIIGATKLIKATENSILSKRAFYKELKRVNEMGYATDNEEYATGIGCLSAPIFDYTNEVIAAIEITGYITLYKDPSAFAKMKAAVLNAAKNISKDMGCSNDYI
jgi:DNA-binding IclR family transcriptional regulator